MKAARPSVLPLLVILLCGVVGVVVYMLFDPAQYVWMPKCSFRLLTGWSCPACGVQRALHALLHGHWAEALNYNYFLVASVPYALALIVGEGLKFLQRGEAFIRAVEHPLIARVYVVLFFVWGVTRNIMGI